MYIYVGVAVRSFWGIYGGRYSLDMACFIV